MTTRLPRRPALLGHGLQFGACASLGTGLAVDVTAKSLDSGPVQWVLTTTLGVFFVLLLARLALAAYDQPRRRFPLLILFAGVLLWAVGSATLNGAGQPTLSSFPAPGEVFFLLSYLAFACYLLSDIGKRHGSTGGTWLEAGTVCGGSVCLAGGVLITPATHNVGAHGVGLLLALLYPLIDVVLTVIVIGQVLLGYRIGARHTIGLAVGFVLLTIADLSFITTLTSGTYDYHWDNIACWGGGFALIVAAACRPRAQFRKHEDRQSQRSLPIAVLLASMAATVVLAFEPDGTLRNYLVVPAFATLAASGGRMMLAVRAAQRAAQAVVLSLSDDLTGLPNRRAVYERLDQRMRSTTPHGLMIMDLDGFKDINDTLGHSAGDAVLREIAQRCSDVPARVMVARLGGDEFAVLADTDDEIVLHEMANAALTRIREPITIDGITMTVDASIGITTRQAEDTLGSEMLRRADIAMYEAKRARLGAVLYDPAGDQFSRERLSLSEDLRRAVETDQLELWYQPQYDAVARRTVTVEALVRWRHPTLGLLNPAEFLPMARRSGLMLALSQEIGRIAVRDMTSWRAIGIDTRIAINCAAPELMSGIFLPRLAETIDAAGLSTNDFTVEVTEDSFLAEPERARATLLELRDLGFELSVDDFGTGFSSLAYLRDLPIAEIKMDRSFISAMRSDERSRLIVVSTFHLADALGLRMVAEGVEDQPTAEDLLALGVHVLQGYHLSRPLPADKLMDHLAAPTRLDLVRGRVAG